MDKETRLKMAIGLSFGFMLVEVTGGIYANSLSILADAAHLFTDVTGFVIALIAVILAKHPPSSSFTYGLARAEVMGAFCSVLTLWMVTIYLVYTAYVRVVLWVEGRAEPVDGKLMFIIAVFGICVNICLALVFHDDASSLSAHAHDHSHEHGHGHEHGHSGHSNEADQDHSHADEKTSLIAKKELHTYGGAEIDADCLEEGNAHDHGHAHAHSEHHDDDHASGHVHHAVQAAGDLNLQAAHMHVIADLIQSAGVALAGAIIWYNPEWQIIDPICTFLFSLLVVWATFALMYRIVSIFMEGTPSHVSRK